MKHLPEIFERNRAWAERTAETDPDYFPRLARQQNPDLLWIGCADSRVPANVVAGLEPGEVFVHRNIANVFPHSDMNALSVLEYAVDALGIEHVVVCGHYGCGGIQAALSALEQPTTTPRCGVIDNWLRHVQDVAEKHSEQLARQDGLDARSRTLCELNALEQARHVARTGIVQRIWNRGGRLVIHAWIYDLSDGLLRDLGFSVASHEELAQS